MAFTPFTATNGGNTASGTITVPAGAPVGATGVVIFTQNNADVLTASPSWLTPVTTVADASANFPVRFYRFTVGDGSSGTVAPGTVGTFTMSATRAWTLTLYGVDGTDPTNPLTVVATAATVTTTAVMPTATTSEALWLAEVAIGKANGTSVTSWTAPTGWTARATTVSPTTFGGTVVIADRDNGLAGAASYGGETYAANAAIAVAQRYLLGFRPAPVSLTYYSPSSDVTTSGWSKTPGTAATFAAVLGDTDAATYAESPTNPANSVLEVALPPIAVAADLSSLQFAADLYVANGTAGTATLALLQGGVVKKSATFTLTTTNTTYTLQPTATDAAALTKTGNSWANLTQRMTVTAS